MEITKVRYHKSRVKLGWLTAEGAEHELNYPKSEAPLESFEDALGNATVPALLVLGLDDAGVDVECREIEFERKKGELYWIAKLVLVSAEGDGGSSLVIPQRSTADGPKKAAVRYEAAVEEVLAEALRFWNGDRKQQSFVHTNGEVRKDLVEETA